MKKFPKVVLFLFLFFVVLVGSWLTVNLWPRPVEPALFTEADLASPVPEIAGQNAYDFLVDLREDGELRDAWEMGDLPQTLTFLYELDAVPSMADPDAFWTEVERRRPKLSSYLRDHRKAVDGYRTYLGFSQLIDRDSTDLGKHKADWIALLELHRFSFLAMEDQVQKGDLGSAYRDWIRLYRLDLSHLASARGMISHMVAITDVKRDLEFSCKLLALPAPAALKAELTSAVREFDPARADFKKSLIADYLFQVSSASSIEAEGKSAGHALWYRIVFNRAGYRKDVNENFRRLMALAADPKSLTKESIERYNRARDEYVSRKRLFWWFYNPVGKLILRIVTVNALGYVKEFEDLKEEILRKTSGKSSSPCSAPL